MAGMTRKFVGISTCGEIPKVLMDRVETMQFVFHNFKAMKEQRGEYKMTPPLEAFGYLWECGLSPRGNSDSSTETEYITCCLNYAGNKTYKPVAKFTIRCKNDRKTSPTRVFGDDHLCWGFTDFLKREDGLENYLEEDGSLIIQVDLQLAEESKRVWYPKQRQQHEDLVQFYTNSSNTSDIVFGLEDQEFHAHTLVLSLHAKTLFEVAKERNNDNTQLDDDHNQTVIIPIQEMKEATFTKILEYIYTVNPTLELDDETAATELLLAANRFDCISLKLYVESMIVEKFLTTANAASMLVLGDSRNCALLKEAAMTLYGSEPHDVKARDVEGWSSVEQSPRLLKELLAYMTNKLVPNQKTDGTTAKRSTNDTAIDIESINQFDVTTLREQLDEVTLDLDGSREVLVNRLKEYHQQQKEQAKKKKPSRKAKKRRRT